MTIDDKYIVEWKDIHLLPKEMIIEMLDYEDVLNMRLVSKRDRWVVSRVQKDINIFLDKICQHSLKEESILYLRHEKTSLGDAGVELKLFVLYKGRYFEDIDNLNINMEEFGMVYKFNDGDIGFYDGVYATPMKETDKGIIFEYGFMTHDYRKLKFIFWIYVNDKFIFDNNDGKKYVVDL